MTVANHVSGRLGPVKVDYMLEQRRTGLFLKNKLALAIVDGRHRCFRVQKLADFNEPGTE